MNGDSFGDLREWGRALEEVEKHTKAGTLDDVQGGLARLIRYRENWRLRERALVAARAVTAPDVELLSAILNVALDENTYTDARVLATRALGDLVPRRAPVPVPDGCDPEAVASALAERLEHPQAPVLRMTQERALDRINRSAVRVAS